MKIKRELIHYKCCLKIKIKRLYIRAIKMKITRELIHYLIINVEK